MTQKLHTIICSTRPGRVGPAVAGWFHEFAGNHGAFDAQLIDLADFNLPLFDEPNHPRMQQYTHEHTKNWSRSVQAADAFVFVTPEYNFGPPPSLLNALNYVYLEWNYKPCGFVSYGGISGGMRSVQISKQTATTLKMMPIFEQVAVPMVGKQLEGEGDARRLRTNEHLENSAGALLDELQRWSVALKRLRADLESGS